MIESIASPSRRAALSIVRMSARTGFLWRRQAIGDRWSFYRLTPNASSSIEVDVKGRHYPRHRVADRVASTAREQQADWVSRRVPRPDARTGVPACAEVAAVALDHELASEPRVADAVVDPAGPVEGDNATHSQLSRPAALSNIPPELRREGLAGDPEVLHGTAREVDQLAADAVRPAPPGGAVHVVRRPAEGDGDEALQDRDLVGRAAATVVGARLTDAVAVDRIVGVGENVVVAQDHEPRVAGGAATHRKATDGPGRDLEVRNRDAARCRPEIEPVRLCVDDTALVQGQRNISGSLDSE